MSGRKEATAASLRRLLQASATAVSSIVVAVFVQKSGDHSSAATLAYIATVGLGSFLVIAGLAGVYFRRHIHSHAWSWYLSEPHWYLPGLIVGATLCYLALAGIDRGSSDFSTPPSAGERAKDSANFALRNLFVGENSRYVRIGITIINTGKSPAVLDSVEYSYSQAPPTHIACTLTGLAYELSDQIEEGVGTIRHGTVVSKSGPAEGIGFPVKGFVYDGCFSKDMKLSFPIQAALQAGEAVDLTFDVPTKMHLINIWHLFPHPQKQYSQGPDSSFDTPLPSEATREQPIDVLIKVSNSGSHETACVSKPLGDKDSTSFSMVFDPECK